MPVTRSALDLRYVHFPVVATRLGVAYDPTGDVVAVAFVVAGTNPVAGDWKAASWETWANGVHYVRALVGPGGVFTGVAGTTYAVWVRVTDSPEIPIAAFDYLTFT